MFFGLRGKGCSEVLLKAGRILPEPIDTSIEGLIKRVKTVVSSMEIYMHNSNRIAIIVGRLTFHKFQDKFYSALVSSTQRNL